MPFVTFEVYKTVVIDRVASAASEKVTLTINDANGDGSIDKAEWQAHTGSPGGSLRGTKAADPDPALWQGAGKGNTGDGTLYSPVSYTKGADLGPVLKTLVPNRFSVSIAGINCFLAGTMIATPEGERPVETLKAGDMVLTLDHGPQPLVWVGQTRVDRNRLDVGPDRRPIQIDAGALGGGLPRRDVRVSPQHRVMVTDAAGRQFLASARHLQAAGTAGVHVLAAAPAHVLVHIALADHQIVLAEGAAMESLFTGPMAVRALSGPARDELARIFPTLAQGVNPMTPARPFLKRRDVEALWAARARVAA